MPGWGYAEHPEDRSAAYWADVLSFAGKSQHVTCSDPRVKARLQDGEGGTYLWVINPTKSTRQVEVSLPASFDRATELWQDDGDTKLSGDSLVTTVGDQNVAVLKLE